MPKRADVLEIVVNPIGFVKTEFAREEPRNHPIEELEADIEILDEYADGLEAIDGARWWLRTGPYATILLEHCALQEDTTSTNSTNRIKRTPDLVRLRL